MEYRTLGRTNLKVSILSLGGGAFYNPRIQSDNVTEIIKYCVANGINFIDTAEDYDETKLREGLKDTREKVILNSKSTSSNKESMVKSIENSLKKLGTDIIDIYQMQTLMDKDDLKNRIKNGALDAIKEAKKQGKINFIGFSSHRIPTIIEAIKTKEFDVVELPYSIGQYESEKAIQVAKKYNVGVIAINVFGGGILVDRNKMSKSASFMTSKNAMQYVISNNNITTALIGMSSIEHVKENIEVANNLRIVSNKDRKKIEEKVYKFLGKDFCRSCKACMPCDVHGWQFSIDNFLRFKAFYSNYGYKVFMNEYQKLPIKADKCILCGKCESRCPYNVKIMQKLKKTHEILNLNITQEDFKERIKEYFNRGFIDKDVLQKIVTYWNELGRDIAADKINSFFMPIGKKPDQDKEKISRIILAGMFYLSKKQFLESLRPYIGNLFLFKQMLKNRLSKILKA